MDFKYQAMEVQQWQLTPFGAQRIQTDTIRGVGPTGRTILSVLRELGGIAEIDEITQVGNVSPSIVNTSLRQLVDLGYIVPVVPPPSG